MTGKPDKASLPAAAEPQALPWLLEPDLPEKSPREHQASRFDSTFLHAPIGQAVHDLSGRCLAVNDALCRLLGRSRRELVEHPPRTWLHPDDQLPPEDTLRSILRIGGAPWFGERRFSRGDGQLVWARVWASLVPGEDGEASWITTQYEDVTALRREQDSRAALLSELEDAVEQAESSSLAKSRFLAKVGHEIRTPMSVILGMCQLAQDRNPSESIPDCLDRIEKAALDQMRVLEEILEYSRSDADHVRADPVPFRPGDLLEASAAECVRRLGKRPVELVRRWDPQELSARLEGDPSAIRRVLGILLSNAEKFTENGSIVLSASLGAGGELRVEVEDTGIGLSRPRDERLFQPFFQEDESSTRRFGGAGLGLAMARRLARLMGGSLVVEERSALGSRFALRIPLRGAPPDPDPKRDGFCLRGRFLEGRNILVAEDTEQVQDLLRIYLGDLGARVQVVPDGRRAVEACLEEKWDLVLMDLQMPVLDGISAVAEIRSRLGAGAPAVVALSADAFPEDRRRCLEAGMVDHVPKPFSLKELAEAVVRNLA